MSNSVIDPELEAIFRSRSGATVPVLISFEQSISTVIDHINSQTFPSLIVKRTAITEVQIAFSEEVQKNLKTHLEAENIACKSYWINNMVAIPDANISMVHSFATKSNIHGIGKIEKLTEVVVPTNDAAAADLPGFIGPALKFGEPRWHLTKIRAPEELKMGYAGKGIVVAHIDSGVRHTHKTLRDNWRTEYGGYGPSGRYRNIPHDTTGHGTATMALLAGKLGFGVAPKAQWISCRNSDVFACGQWIQCPTKADGSGRDCFMAPHVVSNSWGFGGEGEPYIEVVFNWKAAGIIPVFGLGNSGPSCSSYTISPAKYWNGIWCWSQRHLR